MSKIPIGRLIQRIEAEQNSPTQGELGNERKIHSPHVPLDNKEVVEVVSGIRKAFLKLLEEIPEAQIQKKDPNNSWSYDRDITFVSNSCAKKIQKLRDNLIRHHSILLDFIRRKQIGQSEMEQVAAEMKSWGNQSPRSIRKEYVEKKHDKIMDIITIPFQARMKK